MSKGRRALVVTAMGFVCLIIANACNRDLTAPRIQGATAPHVPGEPSLDIASSADRITATTSAPDVWHGKETNANPSPIATFPTATWYRVDANGLITMTPDPRFMPGQPTQKYGPAGNARFTWSYAGINTTVVIGNSTSDSTGNTYVQMSGSLASADRPGYAAVNWNGYCGVGYSDPCGDYSGPPTTFTFTRLNADLSLTADSTNVAPGSTVTFTYGASPTQVEGQTMPVVLDSVRWVPDSSGAGGEPTEQSYSSGANACNTAAKTCTRHIIGPGTFTLIAWVNGKPITKSLHIQTPSLLLAAKPDTLYLGDTATFTPSWTDGAAVTASSVSGWAWTPDSLPGATVACAAAVSPCRAKIKENGTMKVSVSRGGVTRTAIAHVGLHADVFELRAAPYLVAPGGVITFRPFLNSRPAQAIGWKWVPDATAPWDSVAGCAAPAYECHRGTFESGTMWAYGANSKTAHVDVFVNAACAGGLSLRGKQPTMAAQPSQPRNAPPSLSRTAVPARTPPATGQSSLRAPTGRPARTLECNDSLATRGDAGTDSLATTVLHVIVDGNGLDATPQAGDMHLPIGTVVNYRFQPRAGFEGPVVALDSTMDTIPKGTIAVSRERSIEAASDSIWASRPGMALLRQRLRAMISSGNKPVAYAALLRWALDTATSQSVEHDIGLAQYLEFDPGLDSVSLRQFDDAMAARVFEIRGDSIAGHSIAILNPSDYNLPIDTGSLAAGLRRRGSTPRRATAQDSALQSLADSSVEFVYVNGMKTFDGQAVTTAGLLRDLLRHASTMPHTGVAHYWNRNYRTVQNGFALDSCTGRAGRDVEFRQHLVSLYRWAKCKALSLPGILLAGDLSNSIDQFAETEWQTPEAHTADVDSLAQVLAHYHKLRINTIAITHSQGNMVFVEAGRRLPLYEEGFPLQVGSCTADMTLASPIDHFGFTKLDGTPLLDAFHLGGMTVNGDILQLIPFLTNDFAHRDSDTSLVAAPIIAQASGGRQWLLRRQWGLRIHGVDGNYLLGRLRDSTRLEMQRLYNTCAPSW